MQYLATAPPVSIARAKEVIEIFMVDDRLVLAEVEIRKLKIGVTDEVDEAR